MSDLSDAMHVRPKSLPRLADKGLAFYLDVAGFGQNASSCFLRTAFAGVLRAPVTPQCHASNKALRPIHLQRNEGACQARHSSQCSEIRSDGPKNWNASLLLQHKGERTGNTILFFTPSPAPSRTARTPLRAVRHSRSAPDYTLPSFHSGSDGADAVLPSQS